MPGVAVVTGAGRGIGREVARRLSGRGYTVLATDLDAETAAATAEQVGGLSLEHDVRDPDAHRKVAAVAAERGPLEVWVNNAGVLRTQRAWEHDDAEVRLLCEVNLMGVIWGSRAAVEVMSHAPARASPRPRARRAGPGDNRHIINLASMSSFSPTPGLAVYSATKHAVLGFGGSLQADLGAAGIGITVHSVCPDAVDTDMVRERAGDSQAAIIWSGPRMLTPSEVAGHVVELLDGKRLVAVIPRWRGWGARAVAASGRPGLRTADLMRRWGERQRARG